MSIAVSAVVKPSLALFAMLALLCAGIIAIGIVTSLGILGDLNPVLQSLTGAACIFLGLFAFYWTMNARKTHHIDISGNGQIRIGEYIPLTTTVSDATLPVGASRGEVVSLMDNSTIWPSLLLLRLKSEDQRVTIVNVLPDSMSRDGFRALSVACRWIAAHNNSTENKNF